MANTTFSAYAPFAARHNMSVLYSSILSQAFLHPSLCCKARNGQITSSHLPLCRAEGLACVWWNLLLPTSLQLLWFLDIRLCKWGQLLSPTILPSSPSSFSDNNSSNRRWRRSCNLKSWISPVCITRIPTEPKAVFVTKDSNITGLTIVSIGLVLKYN